MKKSKRAAMTVTIPGSLIEEAEAWRQRQPAVPSRSAVIEAALKKWLAKHLPSFVNQ